MDTRTKIILASSAAVAFFMLGRYSNQKPDVKTNTSVDQNKNVEKNTHKVIVQVKNPNGSETTTTTVDSTTNIISKVKTNQQATTSYSSSTLTVSALIGTSIHDFKPIYGALVSKQYGNTINVGVFGMTNGTMGVELGISF